MAYEQRFLKPWVIGKSPAFFTLPSSEINRILEVTRNGLEGAMACLGNEMRNTDQITFLTY